MKRALLLLVFAFAVHAEQKNVQLLTGLSDLELQRTMNAMRAAMGTHCDYCHVIEKEWDFASDAKPAKARAREMIRMVTEINRANFGGRAVVSCYTCHRGSPRPLRLVALPQQPPPFPTPLPAKPQLLDAKAIVARYAQALGDASKLRSRILKGERTNYEGTAPIEVVEKGSSIHQTTGPFEQVWNGKDGWWRNKEGTGAMSPSGKENFLALTAAFAPVLPSEIGDKIETMTKDKIGDREVWVVRAGDTRRLYFDAESGLLARAVLLTPRPVGTIPQQTDYEDWRDAGGAKFPFRVRVSVVDPWAGATRQYTSVQLAAPIDDSAFEAPKP